jgi:putative toxin-antitoxin system antitoxin component (TIGR02293 family)
MASSTSSPEEATPSAPSPALSLPDLLTRLQNPLPVKELWKHASRIGMSSEQFERLSGVSPHRLRRGRGGEALVDADKGEPFQRCAKVFGRVVALCNQDEGAARNWLNADAPLLKNKKPIEVAETKAGLKNVESLVTQLEKAAGLAK